MSVSDQHWLRPNSSASPWHVSPAIDVGAYHFSWLWALVPLLFFGDRHPIDYVLPFVVIMVANFAHRHYTLPMVYLDRQVFAQFPLRFILFPALMFGLFLISPWLWRQGYGRVISISAFAAVLWNLWHIHMQKFGILRLYNAKAARTAKSEAEVDVPRWVDSLLVFGWLPFYLIYLGPANRNLLLEHGPTIRESSMPLIDFMARFSPWLLPPAVALVCVSMALFLVFEWRVHRFRCTPRLSLALGLTLLSASFLVFHPVKVALAYVFTHAIEYIVFVWAFQRRRYAKPLDHRPLMGRLLSRPLLAYGGFLILLAAIYYVCAFHGRYFFQEDRPLRLAGTSLRRWIFYWGIYQSMVHFYFDGFLWKMKLPIYRRAI
jgi:hypothetical protein